MKLLGIVIVGALGSSISREEASNFLVRNRRANSWGEEMRKSGNLERECIEETCDFNEFNEVYDDRKVSDPMWKRFADCKNHVNKRLTEQQQKEQLRACFNQNTQGVQQPSIPVPRPIPDNQFQNQRPIQSDAIPARGPYSEGLKMLPNRGFVDKTDSVWLQVIKDANTRSQRPIVSHDEAFINRVNCELVREPQQGMIGGNKVHKCQITYEGNNLNCRAETTATTCISCGPMNSAPQMSEQRVAWCN